MEIHKHRWFKVFDVVDEMILFISKARIQGGHSKLQQRKYGLYKIIRKINNNT
ncbi:conserved hypothetical protein [Ricinus communis]|uniref:Uncharacterized protein n=1 Tax=Ricinus communis TaxID=3988 RepID=B9REH2_RICCO|nr:conserved hypothetical protein [Ricinus communis]